MSESTASVRLLSKPWDGPFARIDAFQVETSEILESVHRGASLICGFPDMFRPAIGRQVERGVESQESAERRIEEVEKQAKIADNLIQREFSTLRAHLLIGLWGALEALIFELVVVFLKEKPQLIKSEQLSKVRVPLNVIAETDKDLRVARMVDESLQQLRINLIAAPGRFEAALDLVGLGGAVSDQLRKNLFETGQARNLIVHRISIVDRHFAQSCPWLAAQVGTRFEMGTARYTLYAAAITEYTSLLYERVRASVENASRTTL